MRKKKFLLNFTLVVIPLIIIEIFSSIIIYQKEKKISSLFSLFNSNKNLQVNYKINWDNKTNKVIPGEYKTRLRDGRIVKYTINSKGFRNKEFNTKKNTEHRIISFGGSTTMGIESPDDLTYPAILEQILIDKNIDAEVLNFGFGSKSLNFIKDLYLFESLTYKPDFISIYSARNSIMYDSIGTKLKIDTVNNPKLQKINFFLINNIMSFRLLYKIYKKILSSNIDSKKIISPFNEKIEHNIYYFLEQYFNTIKQIVDHADKNEIKVILIKQAFYINPEVQKIIREKTLDNLIDTLQNLREIKTFDLSYKDMFWIVTITILNKQLEKFNHYKNVVVVDPIYDLIENKKNFEDFLHLTDKGNYILANSIFKKIKNKF
tara:strand:+ start:225 stop:1352 length:1128 start_codon:yes stop_codon:yes gene_type:complete